MTCLVAIDTDDTNTPTSSTGPLPLGKDVTTPSKEESSAHWTSKSQVEIQLPVLLNLSACTLQLKMFRKTKTFCDIALELQCAQTNSKVYFRRGKALMNMGEYKSSQRDLDRALELLNGTTKGDNTREKDSVTKELRKLEKMVETAEINRNRQKVALQKMLGGKKGTKVSPNITIISEEEVLEAGPVQLEGDQTPSMSDSTNRLYNNHNHKRAYSTLRAKRPLAKTSEPPTKSYFQWYLGMVERSLRKILFWLGDTEAMTKDFSKEE